MKFHTKIRFAVDMIVQNPFDFIISALLCGIGIALIGFTLLVYLAGNNSIRSAEKTLTQGIENTGVVEIDDLLSDTLKFREDAVNSGVIHSIGTFRFGGFNKAFFPELYDIQKNNTINRSNTVSENTLQMLVVDKELLPLFPLDFVGDKLEEQQDVSGNENIAYLYLGNAYTGIPVGTEFHDTSYSPATTYKVAGILKKDISFASADLLAGVDFTTLRCDINMNYEIICINEGASLYSPWLFSINKTYTMEEGMKELKEIADALNIKIREYPLQTKFNTVGTETQIMEESLSEMLVLIFITITIIVTLLQIVEILHHFHIYGIMYSVGFLSSEIIVIMIIRNIIYYIFSLCTGLLMLFAIGKRYFITNIQVKDMFFELLFQRVFPAGTLFMMFLFCIMTLIPCIVLIRRDPVELIQNG